MKTSSRIIISTINGVIYAFCLMLGSASGCFAQETQGTAAAQTSLRNEPGGGELAVVNPGTALTIRERRGDWSRVAVEGWVRSEQVNSKTAQSAGAPPPPPLTLADYNFEMLSKSVTGNKAAVKVSLTVRNDSAKMISKWNGVLLIYDRLVTGQAGNLLLKAKASDDKTIPAKGTSVVDLFWSEGQNAFQIFSGRTKKTLILEMVDLRAE